MEIDTAQCQPQQSRALLWRLGVDHPVLTWPSQRLVFVCQVQGTAWLEISTAGDAAGRRRNMLLQQILRFATKGVSHCVAFEQLGGLLQICPDMGQRGRIASRAPARSPGSSMLAGSREALGCKLALMHAHLKIQAPYHIQLPEASRFSLSRGAPST